MIMRKRLKWYKLDTSAKIYPALESWNNPALFRVSMSLNETINPDILLEALEKIKDRFSYYNVKQKNGLFWSYFEQNTAKLLVWKDMQSPCKRIYPMFNNGYLYKVKYFKNKIGIDMYHGLTDGYGGLEFLKCLVAHYLLIKGQISEIGEGIMDINQGPRKDEYQDAFIRVLKEEKDNLSKDKKRTLFGKNVTFQLRDTEMRAGNYKIVTGVMSVQELKALSKKHGATITQILTTIYLEALVHVQAKQVKDKSKHKNVAVEVPVNMRNFFPTKCMRNFSLFVIPSIDPRKAKSFEDILDKVKEYTKEYLTHAHLLTMIEDNCSLATNIVTRHIPIFIKNSVIRFITNTSGSNQFSGIISNLGILKLPSNMEDNVQSVNVVVGPAPQKKCSCGLISYQEKVYLTFGRSLKQPHIEKYMYSRLVELGINVQIKSNY